MGGTNNTSSVKKTGLVVLKTRHFYFGENTTFLNGLDNYFVRATGSPLVTAIVFSKSPDMLPSAVLIVQLSF